MNQVGLEQQWLYFLREYIRPVQVKVFIGYDHDVSRHNLIPHQTKPSIDILFASTIIVKIFNSLLSASESYNEFCGAIQTNRAIILEASS